MKKILLLISSLVFVVVLLGFGPVETIKERIDGIIHTDNEKLEDAQAILDKVLEHIADTDPELSFENGQMLDSELGVPRLEILPFSEIKHFNEKEVVDGYIVRPIVNVDNPKLLILLEAVDKDASASLNGALLKVKSDQWADFKDSGILTKALVNENKTVRQGNFLIYVSWEGSEEIVKIFERHVR